VLAEWTGASDRPRPSTGFAPEVPVSRIGRSREPGFAL